LESKTALVPFCSTLVLLCFGTSTYFNSFPLLQNASPKQKANTTEDPKPDEERFEEEELT
jgi:hypothetical protein